jgi:hypothetical protein
MQNRPLRLPAGRPAQPASAWRSSVAGDESLSSDRLAGAGVARHARLAAPDLEGPEAPDLDVVLVLQRLLDRVEEGIHHAGAVLLGNERARGPGHRSRDLLDEISLGHAPP